MNTLSTRLDRLCLLTFDGPLHLGAEGHTGMDMSAIRTTLLADTLWSALVNTWGQVHGAQKQQQMIEAFTHPQNTLPPWRHSDGLPYTPKQLLLPKPARTLQDSQDALQPINETLGEASRLKKLHKKVAFIGVSYLTDYLQGNLSPEELQDLKDVNPTVSLIRSQVSVPRVGQEDASPFNIGGVQFEEGHGLWVWFHNLDPAWEEDLLASLAALGCEGIGGERSNGFGRFSFQWLKVEAPQPQHLERGLWQDIQTLYAWLHNSQGGQSHWYLHLNLTLPTSEDAHRLYQDQEAAYELISRRGFHFSTAPGWPNTPLKKSCVTGVTAGTITQRAPLSGCIQDVTPTLKTGAAPHPLLRYGLGLSAAVSL